MLCVEQLEERRCPTPAWIAPDPGIAACEWQTVVGYTRSMAPLFEGGRLYGPITYSLAPEASALRPQVQAATAAWAKYTPLTFAEVPDRGPNWAPSQLPGPTFPAYARVTIAPVPSGEDADATPPTLAQTARITLSNAHPWTDPAYATTVLTHEWGHVLGLAHEPGNTPSVMTAPPSAAAPTASDIAAIQFLYGSRT